MASAARRAASPLILGAADATTTTPLAAVAPRLSAATQHAFHSTTADIRAAAAATQLLLTGATTTTTPLDVGALSLRPATATPLLLAGAATTSPLLLTATAEVRVAATSPLLLAGAAATTTTTSPLAGASILGRRAVFCSPILSYAASISASFSSPATLHRRCFSTSILGDRKSISAPVYLATAGSRLARRGVATEATQALTPEVKMVLDRMEKASVARHEDYLKELKAFELEIMASYSTAKLANAEAALTAGKVAWRVSTAVLAFGVTTLVAVLQTIKDGWRVDFQTEVKRTLDEMVQKLKEDLRQQVRKEVEVIEAEKALAAKK